MLASAQQTATAARTRLLRDFGRKHVDYSPVRTKDASAGPYVGLTLSGEEVLRYYPDGSCSVAPGRKNVPKVRTALSDCLPEGYSLVNKRRVLGLVGPGIDGVVTGLDHGLRFGAEQAPVVDGYRVDPLD